MMANVQYKTFTPNPTSAPNLPIAPVNYAQQYQDQFSNALRLYFAQIDAFTQYTAVPTSGTTKNRPGAQLFIGQMYFDTTLGIPIWWNGTHWVNSVGTGV
jgi:hypothetical protein